MPTQQIVNNAAHIAANTEIIQHLLDAAKVVGPFIGVIIGLIIWAWKKMERTQDKLETAFVEHIKEDDIIHDLIFKNQRETDEKLNELIGEHKATHKIK